MQGLQNLFFFDLIGIEQVPNATPGRFQQPQEQMLYGYKFVLHGGRLLLCSGKGAVHISGNVELIGFPTAGNTGNLVQFSLGSCFQTFHGNLHLPQQLGNQSPFLPQKGQKQMHLFHLLMMAGPGKGLGTLDGFQRFLSIVAKIHRNTLLLYFSTLLLRVLILFDLTILYFPEMSSG